MAAGIDTRTAQLVQAAQHGDGEAFAAFYERYGALVYRTAYLLLGEAGRAEDATQEVWLRVYRALGSYRPERGAFTTWLHALTVNACLNDRRRRWFGWLSLERARDAGAEPPGAGPPPIERLLQNDEQRRIWRAVQALPFKLRVAVVLRYYHDLRYAEIAEALECPVGTVRSRLHAAHERLRRALAAEGDDELFRD
jgi:RNA polymerase sigma-70 factor (ECF subfamily)